MIISASRRTDIPSYYSEWFVNRLKAGYALIRNPMNHSQVSKIPLHSDMVDCIVFWTKDPANMLDKLSLISSMGYKYYFQFTLNPYDSDIEHNLRPKSEIIRTFIELSNAIGKEKVLWRYDPIILNGTQTIESHKNAFEFMCEKLNNFTGVCTVSFVDIYSKLKTPLKKGLIREITHDEMIRISKMFSKIARNYGIRLQTCSEKVDLSKYGIAPASCIDKGTIEAVCGYSIGAKKDPNQRNGCGCVQSVDIGAYNTCRNGCVYCYANYSEIAVNNNFRKYNSSSEILSDSVREDEKITNRKAKLLKIDINPYSDS